MSICRRRSPRRRKAPARRHSIGSVLVHRAHHRARPQPARPAGERDPARRDGRARERRPPAGAVYRDCVIYDAVAVRDVQRRHPPLRHPDGRRRREPDVPRRGRLAPPARVDVRVVQDETCIRLMTAFIRAHPGCGARTLEKGSRIVFRGVASCKNGPNAHSKIPGTSRTCAHRGIPESARLRPGDHRSQVAGRAPTAPGAGRAVRRRQARRDRRARGVCRPAAQRAS